MGVGVCVLVYLRGRVVCTCVREECTKRKASMRKQVGKKERKGRENDVDKKSEREREKESETEIRNDGVRVCV